MTRNQPLRQFHMPTGSTRSGFAESRSSPRSPVVKTPHRMPFSPRVSSAVAHVDRPIQLETFTFPSPASTSTPSSRGRDRHTKRPRILTDQKMDQGPDPRDVWMLSAATSYGVLPVSTAPAPFVPTTSRTVLKSHSTGSSSSSDSSGRSFPSRTFTSASSASSHDKPLPCPPLGAGSLGCHANYGTATASSPADSVRSRPPLIIRTSSESLSVVGSLKALWKKATAHVRSAPTVFTQARESVLWSGFMPVKAPEEEEIQLPISRPGSRGSGSVRGSMWWRAREVVVVEADRRA